jgi:hypothetical protein
VIGHSIEVVDVVTRCRRRLVRGHPARDSFLPPPIAPRDTVRRHIQGLDRIGHFRSDLLSEPRSHVEPLDVDDEDVRQTVQPLCHFAFLVRLTSLAVPGPIVQLLLCGEGGEAFSERDASIIKTCLASLEFRFASETIGVVIDDHPASRVSDVVERSRKSVPIDGNLEPIDETESRGSVCAAPVPVDIGDGSVFVARKEQSLPRLQSRS